MASRCHHSLGSGESAVLATEPSASISSRTPNLLPGAEQRCSVGCLWKLYMPAGQHQPGLVASIKEAGASLLYTLLPGWLVVSHAIRNSLPAMLAIASPSF